MILLLIEHAAAVVAGVCVVISDAFAPEVVVSALDAARNHLRVAAINRIMKWFPLITSGQ